MWDGYVSPHLPDYTSFLGALARRRGIELRPVLDLACGTGALTRRLGGLASEVVGLDASAPMLDFARTRAHAGSEFVCGDFRDFALGRQFDAVVCASNSLNYVNDTVELGRVFTAVRNHLRPGGVMLFDTITDIGMKGNSGVYFHYEGDGRRFVLVSAYDSNRRRQTARVVVAAGIETHRRIPLDPAEVAAAAKALAWSLTITFPTH